MVPGWARIGEGIKTLLKTNWGIKIFGELLRRMKSSKK